MDPERTGRTFWDWLAEHGSIEDFCWGIVSIAFSVAIAIWIIGSIVSGK